MNDTPKYIQQKQFEIILAKPLKERLNGLFEMTELSRKIIQNRIKTKNPDISEIDLKIELFKAFYRFDYDKDTLNRIAENMRQFWNRKLVLVTK
ncbi:MAG: hypothetical protein U9Q83_07200 [Bacteroidota bacterium]|nr:hypothetical protein [Bacteroidota bacterium]